ncbi:hypothetical protein pb186bvf_016009 [Paramecium bursaria]
MDDKRDYRDGIYKLDSIVAQYRKDSRYLILTKKIEILSNDPYAIFRIYNGDILWMEKIDKKLLDESKKKCQLTGNYSQFCELIQESLENNSFELIQNGLDLVIQLSFKITNTVFLKGEIPIGSGIPVINDPDVRKLQTDFTFDLYEVMQKRNRHVGQEIMIRQDIEQQPVIFNAFLKNKQQQEDDLKPQRKANANIINPNQKKRRVAGAKLA